MIANYVKIATGCWTITCHSLVLLLVLVGCGRSEPLDSSAVQSKLVSWERPQFKPGGGGALVFYVVYGQFPTNIQLSAATYRTAGIPKGVALRKLNREQRSVFPFTDGDFAKVIGRDDPTNFASILAAPECVITQGEVADPADLNYLRDAVGVATWFLDNGGVAVVDPQLVKLYRPEAWRRDIFDPVPPKLANHAVILFSKESDGTQWFHTRGLRKFGRPDLSFRNVPPAYESTVIELFNRFILLQAEGGLIPEGQEIRMAGLPAGADCHHAGSSDDPDFNNVHVEIHWPATSPVGKQ